MRGGLRPATEDKPRPPLDVLSAFAILVGLTWVNFRRHAAPWLRMYGGEGTETFLGLPLWGWYTVAGILATLPVLYFLKIYLDGNRQLVPASPFGKAALMALLLVWLSVGGDTLHWIPRLPGIWGELILWIPATLASLLLLSFASTSERASVPASATVPPSDPTWKVGGKYWLLGGATPFILVGITLLSMGMQEDTRDYGGRKRFGPDAYWRQSSRMIGTWKAVGRAENLSDPGQPASDLPVATLEFSDNREVIATHPSGEVVPNAHRWFLKNQYTWLGWNAKVEGSLDKAEIPLEFQGERLYLALPNGEAKGFVVFEKVKG